MSAFYKLTDSYVSFDLGKCSPKRFGTRVSIPESPTEEKVKKAFEDAIPKQVKEKTDK